MEFIGKLVVACVCVEGVGWLGGVEAVRWGSGGVMAIRPEGYPANASLIWFFFTHVNYCS